MNYKRQIGTQGQAKCKTDERGGEEAKDYKRIEEWERGKSEGETIRTKIENIRERMGEENELK